MKWAAWVFSMLIGLYPDAFRDRFGPAMRETAAERARDARRRGRLHELRFWTRACADVIPSAIRVWRERPARRHEARGPSGGMVAVAVQDGRFAVRTFARRPAVPFAVTLTLALGIGATTAMFSVIDGVLLQPLPYPEPDRLVQLVGRHRVEQTDIGAVNLEDVRDWVSRGDVLAAGAAYTGTNMTLTGDGAPERIAGGLASHGFFEVLGLMPMLGRPFAPDDHVFGAPPVVVLTHGFWETRFDRDPRVLGRTVRLNDVPFEVVGVLPRVSNLVPSNDWAFVAPLVIDPDTWQAGRNPTWLSAMGRLAPGVTVPRAQQRLDAVTEEIAGAFPDVAWRGVRVVSLKEALVGPAEGLLRLLLLAVGFVLLIGCSSVANLLLARAVERRREFAVRSALGAGRRRIVRQVLTESVLLALAGGALGVVLARLGLATILRLSAGAIPRATEITIDWRALGFCAVVSLSVGLLFGIAPALRSARLDPASEMKGGGRTTTGGDVRRVRSTLVTLQLAFSVVLLVGAGLLLKSYWTLASVDPGVRPTGVVTFSATLPPVRYSDESATTAFWNELATRFATVRGVDAVGAGDALPPSGSTWFDNITLGEVRPSRQGEDPSVEIRRITPGYLAALGIPLRAGRDFEARDRADAPLVALVNETAMRRYFDGRPPLGRRIGFFQREYTIVGVVGDVRQSGFAAAPAPAVYFSRAQLPFSSGQVVVRLTGDPVTVVPLLRAELAAIDPAIPMATLSTLRERLSGSLSQPRFRTVLLASFGGVALILALVGVYSIVSYTVRQRTHEFGVRMALGSDARGVRWLVVRQGMTLAAVALALGLVCAAGVAGALESFLFEVEARDPATFAGVAAVLLGVAGAASLVPARAATKIDPLEALKAE